MDLADKMLIGLIGMGVFFVLGSALLPRLLEAVLAVADALAAGTGGQRPEPPRFPGRPRVRDVYDAHGRWMGFQATE